MVHERTREPDPLLLPTRHLTGHPVGQRIHLHGPKRVAHPPVDLLLREPGAAGSERDVAVHAHVGEQRVVLEHEVRRPLERRDLRRLDAVEQQSALGRLLEAGQHPQGRGLAAPARAQQRVELPPRNRQAHVVDRDDIAEPLRDVLQLQRRRVRLAPLARRRPRWLRGHRHPCSLPTFEIRMLSHTINAEIASTTKLSAEPTPQSPRALNSSSIREAIM